MYYLAIVATHIPDTIAAIVSGMCVAILEGSVKCIILIKYIFLAREKIVGWYHTGPKLHQNDVAINELVRRYCPSSVLVIIDAKPRELGLPTEAYKATEEVHDVS